MQQNLVNSSLASGKEMFRSMADKMPGMIWVAGPDMRCTYFNTSWLRFTGRTLEQEQKMMWTEGVHPDDRLECRDTYLEAFHGRQSFRLEHRLRRADGQYRWVLQSGVPWVTEEGGPGGCLGLCLDVTDLKRCKGALQVEHDNLGQLMQKRTASLLVTNARLTQEIAKHTQIAHQLSEQHTQLRALAAEVLVAEERERRRIAIGLHDDIGQVLALLQLKAGELTESEPDGKTGQLLKNIRDLVDQAARATRSATFELSSPILYELGLAAAIQSLGEQHAQESGPAFHFRTDDQMITLADKTRVVIFRIVRELLCNIRKHARASRATVSLCRVGEHLQLTVEDDGVGFDTANIAQRFGPGKGFGLFSIREQIIGIGGRFEVVSSIGKGTRVVVAAPLG
jgi:PAS domain S-box-containing protein